MDVFGFDFTITVATIWSSVYTAELETNISSTVGEGSSKYPELIEVFHSTSF